MTIDEYKKTFSREGTLQEQVFLILKDKEWHCRGCSPVQSKQYAGGGGIQGLQRGTKSRPGLVIKTESKVCKRCGGTQKFDRWTGEFKNATAASNIPEELEKRILAHYGYIDSIEMRKRQSSELVIDHRFPMERYGNVEDENPIDMSEEQIQKKFQLLKKDDSGNHNLLKSRACEKCLATGKRGFFLGIKFFYQGNENWPKSCSRTGEAAKNGCVGCGWYDINKWREELNKFIEKKEK